jgi:hypothetical protein
MGSQKMALFCSVGIEDSTMNISPFFHQESKTALNLKQLYPLSDIVLFPYARYAFWEALKQCAIKSIYLPSFICRDILAPINILNITYYFYTVNEKLEPLLEDIACDAIIMVNYFGFEQPIAPFLEYKKKYTALLIEDNAHGLFSKNRIGNFLGTRGDFGLLSIRKTVFLPNGAALLVNNESLKNILYSSAPIQKTFEDEKYLSKQRLKEKIFYPLIGTAIVLIRRAFRFIKTGSVLPLPDPMSEQQLPTNSCLTPILAEGILAVDIDDEISRRLKMYHSIEKWAKYFGIKPIYTLYEGVVPYEFAFIDNGKADKFEKFLFLKGFFVLPWPDLPDEIASTCPEFYKNIKVVPFLW